MDQSFPALLLQAPPGEMNDVFNDLRIIINNDDQIDAETHIGQYNIDQFIPVKVNDSTVILSKYNQFENSFFDPKQRLLFDVCHLTMDVTNIRPFTIECPMEDKRIQLESAFKRYVGLHYPLGSYQVIDTIDCFYIIIVNTKYNPQNFWNGIWKSITRIPYTTNQITTTIMIHVHYYEDGNVQLNVSKDHTFVHDMEPFKIVKKVVEFDDTFQGLLNNTFSNLSDSFKVLRRALPVTRSKVDWNAISNYKIGAELAK